MLPLHLSWPELLVAGLIIWFSITATRRGPAAVLLSLAGFVVAFILSFALYSGLAEFLAARFNLSLIWSRPLAFISVWIAVETLFSMLGRRFAVRLGYGTRRSPAA